MALSWFNILVLLGLAFVLAYHELWMGGLLLAFFIYCCAKLVADRFWEALWAAVVLVAGLVFFNLVVDKNPPSFLPDTGDPVKLTGVIKNHPVYNEDTTRFILTVAGEKNEKAHIQVFCSFLADLHKGDEISCWGVIKLPSAAGNPGEFNYRRYLANKNIHLVLSLENQEDLNIISRKTGLVSFITDYRRQCEQLFDQVLPANEAAILAGMVLGNKESITDEDYRQFQQTGLAHFFAVSGLHVGYLLLMAYWLSSLLGFSPRVRFLAVCALLLLYGTMVGWPISVSRAVLMSIIGLLAHYLGQENDLSNSLGLAGTIIILHNPLALWEISFQLSFAATWGIVFVFPRLKERIGYKDKKIDFILVPLCAQVAVMPFLAYYFNLFSPVSLLSNIIVVPIAGIVVILGFLSLLVSALPLVFTQIILFPAGFLIEFILAAAGWLKNLPWAFIWAAAPPVWLICVYFAGLIMVLISKKTKIVTAAAVLMGIFLFSICLPASLFNRGNLELVFLDVGQGDSTLIKTPEGRFVLVDGGGSDFYDVGSKKVLPYLRSRGIRELYMVINTHPDTDHLRGLEKVLEEVPARYAGLPSILLEAPEYDRLKELAGYHGTKLIPLQKGQTVAISPVVKLEVLHPPDPWFISEYNNSSLALRGTFDKFSFLLAGDLGREGLRELVNSPRLRAVTILQVPHHGSRDSFVVEFYQQADPGIAVISCGENNPFGHPHQEVMEYLAGNSIMLYRTDKNGAIITESNGKEVSIRVFKSQHYSNELDL
ncbi:MAG: DNA internalization-related competence protein ComEC/Rec2 [Syntrophomonadaceae bacterium]|jgi:competence protein ComEC